MILLFIKKIIFSGLIYATIFATILTSCNKETEKELNKNEQIINPDKVDEITIGFYFGWDGWGRKQIDCRAGNGLCNFGLRKIKIKIKKKKVGAVYVGGNGDLTAEVKVDNDSNFPNNDTNLYLDEDLFSTFENETYKLPAGSYSINYEIGSLGGYLIPLIKL